MRDDTPHRFSDAQAHDRALRLLASRVGCDCTKQVSWDPTHHLQGHVDVGGRHLVLIAPRDDAHEPMILTEEDWDALRRGLRAVA